MRNNVLFSMFCFFLVVCFHSCGRERKEPELPLRVDYLDFAHDAFEIEKAVLPEIGKTREEDLLKLYPMGPSSRLSFDPPLQKTIKDTSFCACKRTKKNKAQAKQPLQRNAEGRSFCVDRIYQYTGVKNAAIENKDFFGYVGIERLYFTVFVCNEVVQYYSVVQVVRPPGDYENWMPGKYDTNDTCCGEQWPGSEQDTAEYLRQRPEMRMR